jgi:hypothetical protein
VLKKLLQLLNRDLTGRTWTEESTHPFFGKILLFAFKNRPDSYWECELNSEGNAIGVCINAPDGMPPDESQAAFAKAILADVDRAFARAHPVLVAEYKKRTGRDVPGQWRDVFRFEGITVPAGGNDLNEWDLSFLDLRDSSGHVWTCYFEQGNPRYATVDS